MQVGDVKKRVLDYPKLLNISSMLLLIAVAIYYNILWDVVLIIGLSLISYLIGSFIKVSTQNIEKIFIKTAIGLGIVGYLVWISITLNINTLSTYIILILILCVVRKEQLGLIYNARELIISEVRDRPLFYTALNVILVFCIIIASYPINNYDALVKHVPIAMNLLVEGKFPSNVVETIVYGEVSLLRYTYTYLLMLFGGNKVIVLFEVFIAFFIFWGLLLITHRFIKNKFVDLLLLFIYFTIIEEEFGEPKLVNVNSPKATKFESEYDYYFIELSGRRSTQNEQI